MKNYKILLCLSLLVSACGPDAPCDKKCMDQKWSDHIYNYRQSVIRANEELKKELADAAAAGYAAASGVIASEYTEVCINHINYLQFQNGITVEYDSDGRIKSCI